MWANYISSGCKFPVVYMCQKLWKLDDSRQSYCKNYLAYFFWPTLYVLININCMVWHRTYWFWYELAVSILFRHFSIIFKLTNFDDLVFSNLCRYFSVYGILQCQLDGAYFGSWSVFNFFNNKADILFPYVELFNMMI